MNLSKKLSINRTMPLLLVLFPLLDLLSSFSNRFLSLPISPGILVKGLLFLAFVYYIYKSLPFLFNEKWLYRLYVFIGITILVSFVVNFFYKEPFSLKNEVIFDFKIFYFFASLLALHLWFKQNLNRTKFYTYLVYSSLFYNVFIWVPSLLGVSFNAYKYEKAGSVGWFYSANEISAILACLFPIVAILYFNKNEISKSLTAVAALSFLPSFFVIGTKVSFAIGFVYSLVFAVMAVITFLKSKKSLSTALVALGFIIYVFYQFNSPAISNTEAHLAKVDTQEESLEDTGTEFAIVNPYVIQYPSPMHPLLNKILSDRDVYLKLHINYLKETLEQEGPIRFFYGMGYATDYSIEPKQIEMDIFDLAFSYGVYFLIAFLILVGIYFRKIISNLLSVKSFAFRTFSFLGVGIICGISFLTGHVIIAPSASFCLALLLAFSSYYFLPNSEKESSGQ